MKYLEDVTALKKILDTSENILITLVKDPSVDALAAGLAMYLTLEQNGKKVSIATDSVIRVGHSHLFGINQVQSETPAPNGGNLTIVLSGVVDPTTSKPITLQELKWHPEGGDLHLVFYPVPGQRFEPTHITPGYEGAKYDVILVIGANSLAELGAVYQSKTDLYAGTHIINIDNDTENSKFGQTILQDPEASSLSEMVQHILEALGLNPQEDAATNILNGIYDATDSLQGSRVSADTFLAISSAIRAGGKRPIVSLENITPVITPSSTEETSEQTMSFTKKPVKTTKPESVKAQIQNVPTGTEETPTEEAAENVTPESDWLTPKIFRGTSVG